MGTESTQDEELGPKTTLKFSRKCLRKGARMGFAHSKLAEVGPSNTPPRNIPSESSDIVKPEKYPKWIPKPNSKRIRAIVSKELK